MPNFYQRINYIAPRGKLVARFLGEAANDAPLPTTNDAVMVGSKLYRVRYRVFDADTRVISIHVTAIKAKR